MSNIIRILPQPFAINNNYSSNKNNNCNKVIIATTTTTTYYSNIVLPEPSHHSLSTQLNSLSVSLSLRKSCQINVSIYNTAHTCVCVCMCSIYAYAIFCLHNSILKMNPSSKFNFVLCMCNNNICSSNNNYYNNNNLISSPPL